MFHMSKQPIPVLLDGDPGHDDAMAWMLAAASPALKILSVTSCSGNQTIEKTTYNALRVMALLGINAPMAMGGTPMLGKEMPVPAVHGASGLDGADLPEPKQAPVDLPAVELMAQVIRSSPDPVTIVPTGPLTNVAALFAAHPALKSRVDRTRQLDPRRRIQYSGRPGGRRHGLPLRSPHRHGGAGRDGEGHAHALRL